MATTMTSANGVSKSPASSAPNGASIVMPRVPILPLSYDSSDSQASALRLIHAVRPEWDSPTSNVKFVRFTDGITNTLLKAVDDVKGATPEEIDREAILLRAYGNGTHVIIDRQREAENHELLMAHGLAPELLARFENGMLYKFIRGSVASTDDLRDPGIYTAVARRLAEWHARIPCLPSAPAAASETNGDSVLSRRRQSIDSAAPGKPAPNMWTVMQKWIFALPTDTEQQRERQAMLQAESDQLVKDLSQRPGLGKNGLVFAHCDLLHGNIIVEPSQDPSSQDLHISFIDYEYATPSPAAFDISNHFAEWAGFECDYSRLPTRSERRSFIAQYVDAYFSLLPSGGAGADLEEETRRLVDEVDLYRGLPGFYWGIWALIQAQISEIDFDYATYAELRLGEYWAWKREADGSRAGEGEDLPLREQRWAEG